MTNASTGPARRPRQINSALTAHSGANKSSVTASRPIVWFRRLCEKG